MTVDTGNTSTSHAVMARTLDDLLLCHSVEMFLYREARLLDERRYREWLELFTEDGIYWIPIDENREPQHCASLVYDYAMRRDERVHHLLEVPFAAQSPPSRTVHFVSNVEVLETSESLLVARSSQEIHELRVGDFRQVGLGEARSFAGYVEHHLVPSDGSYRIALKKIVLLERDLPLSNMTMIL